MAYRVVKPFSFSENGFTLVDLNVGDEREDFAGMQDGLIAEGYIEPISADPVEPVEPAATPPKRGRK